MKQVILVALASLTLATACKKEDTTPAPTPMTVSGSMSSTNEVPAVTVASTATGSFTGTYDKATNLLTYTMTFSGLTGNATAGHLHFGDAKHKGAVWLPFSNVPMATSGTVSGTAVLTTASGASQPDSLLMGHVYANIHTDKNPNGEIRGTVIVK